MYSGGVRSTDLFLEVRMNPSVWNLSPVLGRVEGIPPPTHRSVCVGHGAEFSPALDIELCGLGESLGLYLVGSSGRSMMLQVPCAFFHSIAAKPRGT